LLAQCNRSVQFEFAGLVAEWAPAHACLAALGQSLADVARICLQGEENSADLSRFFAFTQPQQVGAVALEHNPFFTQSAIPSDWTLREMGAAVNQMIGVTLLRMLRQIDRDPRLQEKVAGLLDMDFYRKLEAQCGVNSQYDILEITTLRNKLYTEEKWHGSAICFATGVQNGEPECRSLGIDSTRAPLCRKRSPRAAQRRRSTIPPQSRCAVRQASPAMQ
jgi:hypothetical protein